MSLQREYVRRWCCRRFYRSYNYATKPQTGMKTRERERESERRKRERTEASSLAGESGTVSVYSVRVRRISSADKTDRTSDARCEFHMDVSVKYGRVYATASVGCTFCIRSRGCCARTDRSISSYHIASHPVASHPIDVVSHRYSCRRSR
ncbi:hypothetical protein PUN28_005796 [Cardiocondyla obscurior]|uniref:Uncharacterized protein n=1 Tax=Cardiocondyla obscurior TaxID=286306 RepID=A0AAW2G811_9HYME